jgi:hypothetical protein
LDNIAWFTEHYAKQGRFARARHMHGDLEEMTKLEKALEAAFEQFKVR